LARTESPKKTAIMRRSMWNSRRVRTSAEGGVRRRVSERSGERMGSTARTASLAAHVVVGDAVRLAVELGWVGGAPEEAEDGLLHEADVGRAQLVAELADEDGVALDVAADLGERDAGEERVRAQLATAEAEVLGVAILDACGRARAS